MGPASTARVAANDAPVRSCGPGPPTCIGAQLLAHAACTGGREGSWLQASQHSVMCDMLCVPTLNSPPTGSNPVHPGTAGVCGACGLCRRRRAAGGPGGCPPAQQGADSRQWPRALIGQHGHHSAKPAWQLRSADRPPALPLPCRPSLCPLAMWAQLLVTGAVDTASPTNPHAHNQHTWSRRPVQGAAERSATDFVAHIHLGWGIVSDREALDIHGLATFARQYSKVSSSSRSALSRHPDSWTAREQSRLRHAHLCCAVLGPAHASMALHSGGQRFMMLHT